MVLHIKLWFGTFILFIKILHSESYFFPHKSSSFINTSYSTNFGAQTGTNRGKIVSKKLLSNYKSKSLNLTLVDDIIRKFSESIDDKCTDVRDLQPSHRPVNTEIARYMNFKNALISNSATLIMISIYLIRIFRTLVIARSFLDSLIHINPYLPPFNFIYETTNFYLKFCDSFPKIFGINVLSEIPWALLSSIERYLFSLLANQQ